MNIKTANKMIRKARSVFCYGKVTGVYIKISKTEAYNVVKNLPEFEDQWGRQYVRGSSENDLIIEV